MPEESIVIFENIKRVNEHSSEYWSARELQIHLWYDKWVRFEWAIERAIESCKNSKQKPQDHFAGAGKMVQLWSWSERKLPDYRLSRYACYLIAQNGDPRKTEIAQAQTYFALKTREQEVSENLLEDNRRVELREDLTKYNKNLASTAKSAWVWNYGEFTDYGYMGLYGGMKSRDIHVKKHLKPTEKILDHMGSEELAANLFRATQAEAKIKREWIKWQDKASQAHYDVGKKIRTTIADIGGTMPEKLPTPENIRKVKTRLKKWEKGGNLLWGN